MKVLNMVKLDKKSPPKPDESLIYVALKGKGKNNKNRKIK